MNELVVMDITVVLFVVVRPELDNSVSEVLKVDVVLFVFSMSWVVEVVNLKDKVVVLPVLDTLVVVVLNWDSDVLIMVTVELSLKVQ